jgi:hypothetical protein
MTVIRLSRCWVAGLSHLNISHRCSTFASRKFDYPAVDGFERLGRSEGKLWSRQIVKPGPLGSEQPFRGVVPHLGWDDGGTITRRRYRRVEQRICLGPVVPVNIILTLR